ncbi:RecQ family ATP-dependent DNA helicase [Elizabethkingia anophelis]|uniref:RecQ family ATP-dependent DNA helicase n=1 Tax=Elizabethkingia anophelis TaxID=1117645 RepID=UPI0020B6CBBB|nr:RecQ family ATP-dependent DNA helicase [Elizabethkingia anophelis]MCT3980119.1 RecQ family ATP-dependent DNA helicase [Elizabethkingia anophelis]MCT4023965.1 RecQ family ATP-dependent DNA helicase [Elizabethkingia anophelis]MCT4088259.1 RecQ family ATP-dependent DNA helicase [Elizabethkingia anophelis]MCT4105852.1 RecQ family ATP-dependent DNA helicase [Elizabethkingia anophelis]MCT4228944.1 RecQ family ATP-dependent DNA helicase [Elizabethkingia anophelis]
MKRQEAEQILQQTFKLPKFYDEQWLTIEKILNGEKVLLIEKTGFGKSLCFQFPASIFEGTTVIFSPLIALMRDQVKKLTSLGISAKCINSEQTSEENTQIIEYAKQGKIKILYIAPERQENSEWIEATQQMKLSMVVVDEAHCISVWGHDFRPAFKRIINLVNLLPENLPVLATTATATKRVEKDIEKQIGNGITTIRGNLMRDNFKLSVVKVASQDEKLIWLGQNIEKLPGTGILYTGTRVETEIYSKWFEYLNISTTAYNAGLDAESRIAIENGLMKNEWKCIISTNALGMGIDKPDIRFIIHTQIPQSPIHYYQEIGRAGRDGNPAHIILFYSPEDKKLPEAFIEGGRPSIKKYEKVIETIKSDLLGERELIKQNNIKQNQFRVIKADLIEQGIIREVMIGKNKKYEFVSGSPPLNTKAFEELRDAKLTDLDNMLAYIDTTDSRMKFLCDYLGDNTSHSFTNCDNTGVKKIVINISPEWTESLQKFRENYFPELAVETNYSNIVNGVAASYYGVSNVGAALHRSKYEQSGDFPDFLISLTLKAFRKKFGNEKFDLVVYVPPTASGDLVKNFAEKVAQVLKFPISHNLQKARSTQEQKVFENGYLKIENVSNAFTYTAPDEIRGKSILLIDDIFDSGATIKEVGKILTNFGVTKIAPIVIARTVGGDIV